MQEDLQSSQTSNGRAATLLVLAKVISVQRALQPNTQDPQQSYSEVEAACLQELSGTLQRSPNLIRGSAKEPISEKRLTWSLKAAAAFVKCGKPALVESRASHLKAAIPNCGPFYCNPLLLRMPKKLWLHNQRPHNKVQDLGAHDVPEISRPLILSSC